MEELFAKRLTELIKNSNYILSDMEEAVGKTGATISRYASGEIKGVKRPTIVKLANFFGVSPAWLAGLSDQKYDPKDKLGNPVISIPILGEVKAGYDHLAQENWIGTIDVKSDVLTGNKDEYFALDVKGDSMAGAFLEGDTVIIHRQSDCENNDFAIVIINGDEGTLKMVKKTNFGIILQPLNPAYEPIAFTNEEIQNIPVQIAGVVVRLERDLRKLKK